jgi:hypothetical protein
MATAKLSSSLLAYRDAPGNVSVSQALENRLESTQSALYGSDGTNGPVSNPVVAATGISGLPSPTDEANHRFGPTLRIGLAICGIAAMAAAGIILFTHTTGHAVPTVALQSYPASANVPNPAPAARTLEPSAELQPAVTSASPPPISKLMESPTQLATTGAPVPTAAAPQQLPTAMVAPISPQPELATAALASAPAAPAAGARLSAQEIAALLTRGDVLFRNGDIVSARLCYERAAEGGDAQAALRLGETYDPAFLTRAHLNGVRSDATAAARWYRHARELGAAEAEILLTGVAANDDSANRSKEMNQLFEQFLARHQTR